MKLLDNQIIGQNKLILKTRSIIKKYIKAPIITEEEIEKLGETFMKLENKMKELKEIFGLKDEELNLNLGPLGDLM